MNSVNLIGNITREVETRQTTSGSTVVSFGVAYNEKRKDKEEVSFFECQAWNGTADLISRYCHKGDKVGITGKLKQDRYTKKDGTNASTVRIVVERIDFLSKKEQQVSNINGQPYQSSFYSETTYVSDSDMPF